jgi:hypothetical protein
MFRVNVIRSKGLALFFLPQLKSGAAEVVGPGRREVGDKLDSRHMNEFA